MAHFGVARALDRAGISFDLIAGTSSGAMVAIGYAGGYEPDYGVRQFAATLMPPRWLRMLPGGDRWYLPLMFRSGAWDRLLRPYFHDWTLEQLLMPCSAVAVDLITGRQVVRQQGDAIHALLESINLPVISRPICRDGMALVDGGVLNNLPADVLAGQGADFIVGVNVTAKLPQRFAGNRPGLPTERMKAGGMLETLLRMFEIHDHELNAIHTRAVDLLIEPETAAFEPLRLHEGQGVGRRRRSRRGGRHPAAENDARRDGTTAPMTMSTLLAWKNLAHNKVRTGAAVAGVMFAVVLIFLQLGFLGVTTETASRIYDVLQFDVLIRSQRTRRLAETVPFPRNRLDLAASVAGVREVHPFEIGFRHWRIPSGKNAGYSRPILIMGVKPGDPVFASAEMQGKTRLLTEPEFALIDRLSRAEFGPANGKYFSDQRHRPRKRGRLASRAAGRRLCARRQFRRRGLVGGQ